MSDTVLKLIPRDPFFVPPESSRQRAVELLESMLSEGEECEATVYPRVEFIDQGENLERVICPKCGRELHVDFFSEGDPIAEWWYSISDDADEKGYEGYKVEMPCCKLEAHFTDLSFDWPAGFARFQLSIDNPQINAPLPPEYINALSTVLGCEIRQVWAHY